MHTTPPPLTTSSAPILPPTYACLLLCCATIHISFLPCCSAATHQSLPSLCVHTTHDFLLHFCPYTFYLCYSLVPDSTYTIIFFSRLPPCLSVQDRLGVSSSMMLHTCTRFHITTCSTCAFLLRCRLLFSNFRFFYGCTMNLQKGVPYTHTLHTLHTIHRFLFCSDFTIPPTMLYHTLSFSYFTVLYI